MFQVVWFKRDLRVEDHAPLAAAAHLGPVLPLYIAEPGYWALPDSSGRQWAFIAEALAGLREALARIGQPLIIRSGDALDLLARLHARHGIAGLWSHEETGNLWTFARDRAVARFCRENGIGWTQMPQFGVVRGLKDRDQWARRFDRFMRQPVTPPPAVLPSVPGIAPGPIPSSGELGIASDHCPLRQTGGRLEALRLLGSFFQGRGRGYSARMSSPLTAGESCSRLSPIFLPGPYRCVRSCSMLGASEG